MYAVVGVVVFVRLMSTAVIECAWIALPWASVGTQLIFVWRLTHHRWRRRTHFLHSLLRFSVSGPRIVCSRPTLPSAFSIVASHLRHHRWRWTLSFSG